MLQFFVNRLWPWLSNILGLYMFGVGHQILIHFLSMLTLYKLFSLLNWRPGPGGHILVSTFCNPRPNGHILVATSRWPPSSGYVLVSTSWWPRPGYHFLAATPWHPSPGGHVLASTPLLAMSWHPRPGIQVLSATSWHPHPDGHVLASTSWRVIILMNTTWLYIAWTLVYFMIESMLHTVLQFNSRTKYSFLKY